MKIDRAKFSHWLYLALFALNVVIAMALRWLPRRDSTRQVVLYGHKLNGNIEAIHDHLRRVGESSIKATYLTMDPSYYRKLLAQGTPCALAISPRCIWLLATASAVISDHGLHALALMLGRTSIGFFDVWHGIPFKGFDGKDFELQHRYDEVWVASPLLERMYIDKFGFKPSQLKVTGYARTDCLVERAAPDQALRTRIGLSAAKTGKVVLFAPTWKQDDRQRSLLPFGIDPQAFFSSLDELCRRTDATILIRAHLNSADFQPPEGGRILSVPHAQFPDTEQILLLSDVLVCDWSSIAFDYLLLDRPTIFLDVEAPFAKGFSLDPSYRFGAIVADMQDLLSRLEQYLTDPDAYRKQFAAKSAEIRQKVYGEFADGISADRCVLQLTDWLLKGESSR